MTKTSAPRATRTAIAAAIRPADLSANAPAAPEQNTAAALAAPKTADNAAGPLLAIPTPAQACAILDGAAGAEDWAAYRDQLAALVAKAIRGDRADLAAMSANLSALLAPVMLAAAPGGEWAARMVKAYGKAEGDKRREKAAAKVKTHLNATMQKADASLFMVADWAAGAVMVFAAPEAPDSLPAKAKAAGFQAAAYKSARAAAIARLNAAYDNNAKAKAKEKAAAFVASIADRAKPEAAAAPVAAPAMVTAKDTGPAMDAIATIRAALADGTADRIAVERLQALAADLAGYLTERSAKDAERAARSAASASSVTANRSKPRKAA